MADLSVTAADVGVSDSSGSLIIVQAGEAVTQGQPGYLDSNDSKYYQTDADASATAANAAGVFMTAASADGYAVLARTGVTVDLGATLTVGETYVVSPNKGGIMPVGDLATGDYVTTLGVATTASKLPLDISASGVAVP